MCVRTRPTTRFARARRHRGCTHQEELAARVLGVAFQQRFDGSEDAVRRAGERNAAPAGRELAPKLLDSYAAVIWEDQDECLEVRPEDLAV